MGEAGMGREKLAIQDLYKRFGSITAVNHMDLRIDEGRLVSFLGPSGCGKTTTLRMIAGLENPDGGSIAVDGAILSDAGHVAPPERRNMGRVFQSYAVWPHMNVFDNIGYGLRIKKVPGAELKKRVAAMLELVGLGGFGDRYPTQLSGGQQQRVALARALSNEPSILLLDEPLSNLDAKLRENMRFEIRSLQQRLGITAIYVTHSQDEALAVSDEIVIMRDGRILQRGAPEEVYGRPNSVFVAEFIGLANVFPCQVRRIEADCLLLELSGGQSVFSSRGGKTWSIGDKPSLIVRPENMRMYKIGDPAAPECVNQIEATVKSVSFTGSIVNYFLDFKGMDAGECRCQSTPPVKFGDNEKIILRFSPESCILV
jgi:iron(III) transport system ATP-binding protein